MLACVASSDGKTLPGFAPPRKAHALNRRTLKTGRILRWIVDLARKVASMPKIPGGRTGEQVFVARPAERLSPAGTSDWHSASLFYTSDPADEEAR
ncbi:hypothetical protein DV959_13760, partial [Staphylococcus pseudintermedius]